MRLQSVWQCSEQNSEGKDPCVEVVEEDLLSCQSLSPFLIRQKSEEFMSSLREMVQVPELQPLLVKVISTMHSTLALEIQNRLYLLLLVLRRPIRLQGKHSTDLISISTQSLSS